MSYTTNVIYDDEYTDCPCCGYSLMLDTHDIVEFNEGKSVPIECIECNTIFYLHP